MTWQECVSSSRASWLREALQRELHYAAPLPVQSAVVPTVCRALQSGLALDVSLTAPTGSGKTLCYVLPLLCMIADAKRGNDDTRLRGLVLVPTRALGQQVCREVRRLTRHTSITVVSLCDEQPSVHAEAQTLVRHVRIHGGGHACRVVDVTSSSNNNNNNKNADDDDADSGGGDVAAAVVSSSETAAAVTYHYSRADVVVATPQRLLRHLDGTAGLRLATLRLLVVDEADQVLSGSFASAAVKVVERVEHEVRAQLRREARLAGNDNTAMTATTTTTTAMMMPVLHKMLCSATLSARMTRISQVRLRNCRHFTLDSAGVEVTAADDDDDNAAIAGGGGDDARQQQQQDATAPAAARVRTSFALPPNLHEHIVFVEDSYRHAVLLKLVRTLLTRLAARAQRRRRRVRRDDNNDDNNDDDDNNDEDDAQAAPHRASDYPCVDDDDAGSRLLVFCNSADEARVTGHFLYAAGVRDVVEFTTAATPAERRRALLQRDAACVVATDALMRGIDMADVGHVILYRAPVSVAQYVHRAGRTARALRSGHLHLLLSKHGASGGSLADGEVAAYRAISAAVTRTRAPRYERHFFYFAHAPQQQRHHDDNDAATTTAAAGVAVKGSKRTRTASHDDNVRDEAHAPSPHAHSVDDNNNNDDNDDESRRSAEWWIAEAERALAHSQRHLRVQWSSAHEYNTRSHAARDEDDERTSSSGSSTATRQHKNE